MKRILMLGAAASVLLASAPALAQTASAAETAAMTAPPVTPVAPPLDYVHRTLPNGLQVYTLQDRSSPTVTVQVWYNVGSKDDPQGRSGFAHLFEHILSRMTRNIPRGYINTLVEDVGGTRNASTGPDMTNYYEVVPSNFLETMLWTHAERMDRLVVDQSIFEAERSIVQEELRQRVLAVPYGRLQRFVMIENSWLNSPYHRPGIGSIEELNAATVDDALAFHDAYYRPDNATLIVAGDFDQAQLDGWIDEHFGPITAPDRPIPRYTAEEPERTGPRSVTAYAPNVPLPAIVWSYPAPRVDHPDTAALQVMDAILTTGSSSRFHEALVRGGVASTATAWNYQLEDGGFYGPYVIVAGESSIEAAEAALQSQIDRIRTEPVTEAELAEARTEILSQALQARQTASGRAFALGTSLTDTGGDPDWADRNLAAVAQVSAADVQRVAQAWLDDNRRVSIRYLDESQRPEGEADQAAPSAERYGLDLPPNQRPLVTHASDAERIAPPEPTEPRSPTPPQFSERTLSNGLRVIVARAGDQPWFTAHMMVNGGDAAEDGQSAVSDYMAAMLTRGAGDLSATDIAARVESLGGNVFSGGASTRQTLTVSVPAVNAEQGAALMATIALEPTFDATELEQYRDQSIDRYNVSLRQPGTVAAEVSTRLLFGDTPYGAGSSTVAQQQAVTRDQLVAFHDTWWRPDNATLLIGGSIEPEAAFALAEQMFGGWTAPSSAVPATRDLAGPERGPRVVVVDMGSGAGQAAVQINLRTVERSDPDFYPLSLANAVLGGGSNGRLFQEVRARRGLSYGSYSSLGQAREAGRLTLTAQTRNDAAAETTGVMLDQLQSLIDSPPDQGAIDRRTNFLNGGFGRGIETTAGLTGTLASFAGLGLPLEEVSNYPRAIDAVTAEDVARVSAARIDPSAAVIVVVGDAAQFIEPLRARWPNAEVIAYDALDFDRADLGLPAAQ